MLRELRIENLLLIERAELRLGEGLNAITGETGAGKTVLAHSLDLLMGGKARPQIVRPGAEEAWVEGVFDLPAGLLEEPEMAEIAERLPEGADEVVLGRRVSASGRTSAFLAGRAASAADLKLLGGRLLAFYGQHEHRKLTISSAQMDVLDGFAGPAQLELRERYREAHRECLRLAAELAELRERDGSRERDLDLFRYELAEIEEVAPDPAEEAELAASAIGLRHAEGLREAAAGAHAAALGAEEDGGGAASCPGPGRGAAAGRRRRRRRASTRSPRALGALAIELGDVAGELRDYVDGLEADPGRLAAVEERLDALDRLQRKHGGSVESVLAHAEHCRSEIARLESAEERGAEAEAALAEAESAPRPSSARSSARPAPRPPRRCSARSPRSWSGWRCRAPRSRSCSSRIPDGFGPSGAGDGRAAPGAESGHRAGAAARRRLRRRALAGDAGAEQPRRRGRRRRPWSSTRSTPASAARPPAPSASGCARSARGARCSASPTCPRSPRWPTTHFTLEKDVSGERASATVRASTARAWSRRSAACSAASAATRRRRGTPASCSPPPRGLRRGC